MKLNLSCQEVSRMISDRQDLTLPAADRARFRLHLVICSNCRNVSEQMDFLRLALRAMQVERPDAGATRPSDLV